MPIWNQHYDPLGSGLLSPLVAALPAAMLLIAIAFFEIRIHYAALMGLAAALLIAMGIYGMPVQLAAASAVYGAGFGIFPIGWVILNIIFVYQLTTRRGHFDALRHSLTAVAPDPRIQLVLIAFSFGAFIEGMAGFGAPVAITAAILIQLGFKPLHASGLALIANTAPVAFGSLGIPLTTLEQVTGLDVKLLSAMAGRQLAIFGLLIPFWIVVAFSGFRGLRGVWPAALTAGLSFAVPQLLISNLHGPWLAAPLSGICSIISLVILLRFWKPKQLWKLDKDGNGIPCSHTEISEEPGVGKPIPESTHTVFQAWLPWLILTAFILVWGLPFIKSALDVMCPFKFPMPWLDGLVQRTPPIVPAGAKPEAAVFKLNILSSSGTGILIAAIIAGFCMGFNLRQLGRVYLETIWHVRYSLLTIAAMLALGNVTRYSGTDATMGLAMAQTGHFYPFFGTMLGWIGVALTGSDTASNVLFGSLQKITAQQLGISAFLMCAANSTGGVMGKMIDSQSIVVAGMATNWTGHEGSILRYVFFHSLALAVMVATLVYLQAYVYPFTLMVVK
jgi:lactate permease